MEGAKTRAVAKSSAFTLYQLKLTFKPNYHAIWLRNVTVKTNFQLHENHFNRQGVKLRNKKNQAPLIKSRTATVRQLGWNARQNTAANQRVPTCQNNARRHANNRDVPVSFPQPKQNRKRAYQLLPSKSARKCANMQLIIFSSPVSLLWLLRRDLPYGQATTCLIFLWTGKYSLINFLVSAIPGKLKFKLFSWIISWTRAKGSTLVVAPLFRNVSTR